MINLFSIYNSTFNITKMILPIVVYGDPVLRKKCVEIEKSHPNLEQIIKDMYETMYDANGVGIAAPQVGKPIRLFLVDASPFAEVDEDEEPEFSEAEMKEMNGFKKTFINARILEEVGEEWKFNEWVFLLVEPLYQRHLHRTSSRTYL